MKFAHRYKLLKPIPGYDAGRTIAWNGNAQRFYFRAISTWKHDNGAEGIYLDLEGPKFTVEQTQDTEWFEPLDPLKDFIPPFPAQEKLGEYIDLVPDCHLVNDVDECRAINALLENSGFQRSLYDFYKASYDDFHKLTAKES